MARKFIIGARGNLRIDLYALLYCQILFLFVSQYFADVLVSSYCHLQTFYKYLHVWFQSTREVQNQYIIFKHKNVFQCNTEHIREAGGDMS